MVLEPSCFERSAIFFRTVECLVPRAFSFWQANSLLLVFLQKPFYDSTEGQSEVSPTSRPWHWWRWALWTRPTYGASHQRCRRQIIACVVLNWYIHVYLCSELTYSCLFVLFIWTQITCSSLCMFDDFLTYGKTQCKYLHPHLQGPPRPDPWFSNSFKEFLLCPFVRHCFIIFVIGIRMF